MNSNTKFWVKELKKLNGGIIQNPIISGEDEEEFDSEFFGLEIRMPNGEIKLMWILMDEEGNGPGAVDIVHNYKKDIVYSPL